MLISVVAAVLCDDARAAASATATAPTPASSPASGSYVVVMVVAGALMPTVNEVGDFPADTLWYFRRASLITSATMWGVLGVVLSGLVGRLYNREQSVAARRALAASL